MNNYSANSEPTVFTSENTKIGTSFVANVFMWLFGALLVSGALAYMFGTNENLIRLLYSQSGFTSLGYIIAFAPLGLVMLMSFGYKKLSSTGLAIVFIIYAGLTGASLGFIFIAFQLSTIYNAFAITAGMFVLMSILGYTTKMDLTKFGSIMIMGLIGIVIASVVNLFLRSDAMDFIICIIGVIVFTGLTAYDVQNIKKNAQYAGAHPETTRKMTIMSALSLYLNFINLFLMILRLLGRRR
ncbi:MAG: BAX inhibitor (BI)-1/YccA family protein [Marinilabiliales bacterium]|nr:MAG: BAX inhibitor (BI)-1/YccA family protein [Marinilabiliales bacterium]